MVRRRAGLVGVVAVLLASGVGVGITAVVRSRVGAPVVVRPRSTPVAPTDRGSALAEDLDSPIVFAESWGGRFHLYLINPDGTGIHGLTFGVGEERTPEWSPDRERIAFARFARPGGAVADIYIIRADGSGLRQLTMGPEVEEDPSWSPDGDRIVFTASDRSTGRTRIRIARIDGGTTPQLPDPPVGCIDREPAWSPDGLSIAFARKCGDTPSKLYVIHADGKGLRLVDGFGRTPDWSPDGSKIAYTGWGDYGPAIFIASIEGTERIQLTTDGTADPAWSPDGSRIAFTVGGLALRLFVIDIDGHNQRAVNHSTSDQVMPAW
jgi:Tol biopolymer transport system component